MLLLRALIGINVVVFLLWQFGNDPSRPLYALMGTNFLVSWGHLAHGYFWTLLTSAFSHEAVWHIAFNMMMLYSFGTVLVHRWGSRRFLAFYLAAAIVASLAHVGVGWLIGRHEAALGASGATSALLAAFTVFHPRHKILIFAIIPMTAYVGTALFVGLDVWGLVAQSTGGGLAIGHGAHLGGAAFGFVYAWLRREPTGTFLSEADIVALIDKARAGGVEALTPVERAQLAALLRDTRG